MITLLTPTGGRPECFALCEQYVARQTVQDFRWIVVDDCDPPTACTMGQTVIRPDLRWPHHPAGNTQWRNTAALLDYWFENSESSDAAVVIEDDDWYGPEYLEIMADRLNRVDLAGEIPAWYYNVRLGAFRAFPATPHASLAATGFTARMIPGILDICARQKWIDMTLWAAFGKSHGRLFDGQNVVGIKGMPGRGGISNAHREEHGWQGDPDGFRLRERIGQDAVHYARYKIQETGIHFRGRAHSVMDLKTFMFDGQLRYRCPDCGFDSYSEENVAKHWAGSHREEGESVPTTLFDSHDKPLNKIIVLPQDKDI